jgi:hypothetical protein
MPSNSGFLLGSPPFKFLARHLAEDEDFLRDARRILELDQDTYSRLVTMLGGSTSFLDRASLESLIREVIANSDEARSVTSIIYRLANLLHDADMPVGEAMKELGETLVEKAETVEARDRQTLTDRIRALVADSVGLAKQYKARQLVDATGSELGAFQFLCDIRPIFDQSRERIEGAIPLAILRLEYLTPDRDTAVVEVRVTEKQLQEFADKTKTAMRKLALTKQLLTDQHVPIPRTKSTVAEED